MMRYLDYAYFMEIGIYFTLGCLVTLAWLKLMYTLLDYIMSLFSKSIYAKAFNPDTEYALYASVMIGSVRYYLVGIGKDETTSSKTYLLSRDTDPKNAEYKITIKKPLS